MKNLVPIAITPYLNMRAFVHHGAPAGCELVPLAPREAGPAIASGRIPAGVVPVGALSELGRQVELLGDYGIACPGPSRSVLFFSHRPFDELDEHSVIGVTRESRSSVRLLYLLLAYRGRALPRLAAPGEALDGELVIGDAALRRVREREYPHVVDLAERWQQHHGLPMVFARWVVNRHAPRALRARLQLWLSAFAMHEAALLERAAAADYAMAGLDPASARDYLAGIRSVLKAEDLRGQALYLSELARHDWPDFPCSAPRALQESN